MEKTAPGVTKEAQLETPTSDATKAEDSKQEHEWLSGLQLWIIMTGVVLPVFLMLLDTSIIATAIPQITTHFNSLQDVGWYGAAYQLASAVLQPLAGKLYVNFNTKWTFLACFGVFELGSLICGVAVSSNMLIVGRAIAGMGTAGIQNGAFAIISEISPLHKRAALVGIAQGGSQLGVVIGPLIGGALTQYTTWRWCFYINLPLGGLVAALLVFTGIPDSQTKPRPMTAVRELHKRLDIAGFALFAPAVTMLLLAIQWGGNKFEWNSPKVLGLLCGGFPGMLLLWLSWNWHKGEEALIPFSVLSNTTVWSSCLFLGAIMSGLNCASYYLPIYFQAVDGVSPTKSGVYLLPSILAQLFSAVAAGKLVGVVGYYVPFALFSAVLTSIGYGFSSTLDSHTTTGEWIGFQILFGAGRGAGFQMPIVAIQHALSPAQAPLGVALCLFTGMLGGAVFLSLAATIFTNSLRSLIPARAPDVNAQVVIDAGATGFRQVVSGDRLKGVLLAYSLSLGRVWYMLAGLAAASFVVAWGIGWKDIREKPKQSESKA